MRTTLTIDDDVDAMLKQKLRSSGEPLKRAVNRYLKLGMQAERRQSRPKPFKVRPFSVGLPVSWDYSKVSSLIEKLDDPDFP